MADHVFISHASESLADAQALCALIEAKGVKAWIAPRDVRPGIDYSEELQSAIERCFAFAILVTEKANTAPYVRASRYRAGVQQRQADLSGPPDRHPAGARARLLFSRSGTGPTPSAPTANPSSNRSVSNCGRRAGARNLRRRQSRIRRLRRACWSRARSPPRCLDRRRRPPHRPRGGLFRRSWR